MTFAAGDRVRLSGSFLAFTGQRKGGDGYEAPPPPPVQARYWILERLETRTREQLIRMRARALRLRLHPKQLKSPHFELGLEEFDAYVARRFGR